jgi:viroplasmin and RNaseH domain-containing protein
MIQRRRKTDNEEQTSEVEDEAESLLEETLEEAMVEEIEWRMKDQWRAVKVSQDVRMYAGRDSGRYYAVRQGRVQDIYRNWDDCCT